MVNLDITLLPKQREILEHPARFKTACCGRRFGKSQMSAYKIMLEALNKPWGIYWVVSPTYPQTKIIWRMLKKFLPREVVNRIMEGELYIELKNHATIWAKSGDQPDNLRGEGLDGVVLDECAMLKPEVWQEAIRPALSDKGGWAIFISTPKGKNWFYEVFMRGIDQEQQEFMSFHYTTMDNPLIPPSEIEEMRKSMPEIKFRQEVLAEFVDDGGLVFRGLEKVLDASPEEAVSSEFYVTGVDLGRHEDFTVIRTSKMSTKSEVFRERFNRTDWDYIKDRIRDVYKRYNNSVVLIDSTGYGDPIYEDLAKEGMNIHGINLNAKTKPEIIENLQLMIENQLIHLIDDKDLRVEFGAYTYERLPSGNFRYGAPEGFHDDIVIATALMAYGMYGGGHTGMVGIVDPEPISENEIDYEDMQDYANWWEDEVSDDI